MSNAVAAARRVFTFFFSPLVKKHFLRIMRRVLHRSLHRRGGDAGWRVLLSPEKPTAHDQPPPFSLARARLASTPLLLSTTRPTTSVSFYTLLITLRRTCVNRRINYKMYLRRRRGEKIKFPIIITPSTRVREKHGNNFRSGILSQVAFFYFYLLDFSFNIVSHNIVFARPKTTRGFAPKR